MTLDDIVAVLPHFPRVEKTGQEVAREAVGNLIRWDGFAKTRAKVHDELRLGEWIRYDLECR